MSNTNRITNGAIAAAVATVFGASAVYAETVNATANVTIETGFTFIQATELEFGRIAVLKTITAGADVMVTMNSSTAVATTSDATEVAILSGITRTNLVLEATDAPPFTVMEINGGVALPSINLQLGTNPDILLGSFVEDGGGVTTDAAGALTLQYGATLAFSNGETYGSGLYSNNFDVTLDFP